MHTAFHRALRILAHPVTVIIFAILAALAVAWSWPKSVPIPGGSARYVGFLSLQGSLLGPQYRLLHIELDTDLYYDVEVSGRDYCAFSSYYPDGRLRAKGTVYVQFDTATSIPVPIGWKVADGEFFKPDGTLGGEVRRGNGLVAIWHPDGTRFFENKLRDHKREQFRSWHSNGQIFWECSLAMESGDFTAVSYYDTGSKKSECRMRWDRLGSYDPIGPWTHYQTDGTIEKIEHWDQGTLTRTEFPESSPEDKPEAATPTDKTP